MRVGAKVCLTMMVAPVGCMLVLHVGGFHGQNSRIRYHERPNKNLQLLWATLRVSNASGPTIHVLELHTDEKLRKSGGLLRKPRTRPGEAVDPRRIELSRMVHICLASGFEILEDFLYYTLPIL